MENRHYDKRDRCPIPVRQRPQITQIIKVTGLSVLLLLFVSVSASQGQDSGAAVDMTGMGIYAMEDAVKEAARSTNPTRKKPSDNSKKITIRQQASLLTFTPSAERRRQNLAGFAAKVRAKNPQAGADLHRSFAAGDIIQKMNQELVKVGLKPNNIADAYAAWWINAWLASRGRFDTPPRIQIAAVRSQTVQALLNVPAVASASDASKQQMAEGFLIQAALIGGALEQSKNNSAHIKAIADRVRQDAQAVGLDLDSFNLTNKGFEIKH